MFIHYLKGWLLWHKLKNHYKVNYKKVIVVLSGDNHELDRQALYHLNDYIKKKYANSALILYKKEAMHAWSKIITPDIKYETCLLPSEKIDLLYSYYSFIKFFDNIVFTYTDTPEYNKLGAYLKKTDVCEEEAACLVLYNLRHIPQTRRTIEKNV